MTESATRDRMVSGAAQLLSRAGLSEASFRNVIALTGAPRGSIYHHFPGGKDELVGASMRWIGGRLVAALRASEVAGPDEVVVLFAGMFRRLLVASTTESGIEAGCAVAAVASSAPAGSEPATAAAEVFAAWEAELTQLFVRSGVPAAQSPALAVTTLAVVEGALVLARARGDVLVFDTAVDQLLLLVGKQRKTRRS